MHGIQALTTIPDPHRRRDRHYPRFGLLAIVLRAAMHPSHTRVQGRTENMCDARVQQHQNAMVGRLDPVPTKMRTLKSPSAGVITIAR